VRRLARRSVSFALTVIILWFAALAVLLAVLFA
jgi:hypothetical protein